MWPPARDDKLFASTLLGLIVLAWVSLWIWSSSPWGRFLGHEEGGEAGLAGDYLVLLLFFVAGWTLMTAAMMLPTSLPLVTIFRGLVRRRPDGGVLVALVVVGYLAVWTLFAVVVHTADRGIHAAVHHVAWLDDNAWVIGAGTVLLAGIYQFSSLKYRCLDKCRSPFSFVMSHWRGGRERSEALRLGADHGLFCLGCCWSLMLVMFAVGIGNLASMFALAAVMAFEKNHPLGRRFSAPLRAARMAAVSPRTIQDAATVQDADPELFQQIKHGLIPADKAARRIRQRHRVDEVNPNPAMPEGPFQVIYADPPWRLGGDPESAHAVENHYATLPFAGIAEMEIPACEDAICFLWATGGTLAAPTASR